MRDHAAVTRATLLEGSVGSCADEWSWSSDVALATLLGGSDGSSIDEWSWSSAAGGEDEDLPGKTPGGGDCAGRPTTASRGGGDGGGGGGWRYRQRG